MGILDRDYAKENFDYNTMSYNHPKFTNHSKNSNTSHDIKVREQFLLDQRKNPPKYVKKDNNKLSDSLRYRYSTSNHLIMPSDINVSLHRPLISFRTFLLFCLFLGVLLGLKNIS